MHGYVVIPILSRIEFFTISLQSTLINAIYDLKQFKKHEKK